MIPVTTTAAQHGAVLRLGGPSAGSLLQPTREYCEAALASLGAEHTDTDTFYLSMREYVPHVLDSDGKLDPSTTQRLQPGSHWLLEHASTPPNATTTFTFTSTSTSTSAPSDDSTRWVVLPTSRSVLSGPSSLSPLLETLGAFREARLLTVSGRVYRVGDGTVHIGTVSHHARGDQMAVGLFVSVDGADAGRVAQLMQCLREGVLPAGSQLRWLSRGEEGAEREKEKEKEQERDDGTPRGGSVGVGEARVWGPVVWGSDVWALHVIATHAVRDEPRMRQG